MLLFGRPTPAFPYTSGLYSGSGKQTQNRQRVKQTSEHVSILLTRACPKNCLVCSEKIMLNRNCFAWSNQFQRSFYGNANETNKRQEIFLHHDMRSLGIRASQV